MCKYVDLKSGKCNITKANCPYVYYCTKNLCYKSLRAMPDLCKVAENYELPNGYYKVCYGRQGKLYVEVDNAVVIVANHYDFTPNYVKLTLTNEGAWTVQDAR